MNWSMYVLPLMGIPLRPHRTEPFAHSRSIAAAAHQPKGWPNPPLAPVGSPSPAAPRIATQRRRTTATDWRTRLPRKNTPCRLTLEQATALSESHATAPGRRQQACRLTAREPLGLRRPLPPRSRRARALGVRSLAEADAFAAQADPRARRGCDRRHALWARGDRAARVTQLRRLLARRRLRHRVAAPDVQPARRPL